MALDFWTQDKLSGLLSDQKQAVAAMAGTATQLGYLGVRSVQLWQQAAALDPDNAAAAGAAFAADAAVQWAANKTSIVAGLDATAAGMGVTRQQLLDEIAAAPATSFS